MIGRRNKLIEELKKQQQTSTVQHNFFQKKNFGRKYWMKVLGIACLLMISVTIILPTIIVQLKRPGNQMIAYEVDTNTPETTETIEVTVKREATGEEERVELEDYVFSVVASEMPANFELEALKAQAVAARTYVIQQMYVGKGTIADTTSDQVYKNELELQKQWGNDYAEKRDKIKQAVEATAGKIIMYHDEPITPTFFSMSNGYTENAEDYWGNPYPYLKSVESKWEESLPNFTEQQTFTYAQLNEKLQTNINPNEIPHIKIERTASNRVNQLYINDHSLSGREVREKLGLRSNDFTIVQNDAHFIFTTKGFGHGVGMSQYGANEMAKLGKTFEEILTYYYQQVEIETLEQLPQQWMVAFH